jgi:hypothetical protein
MIIILWGVHGSIPTPNVEMAVRKNLYIALDGATLADTPSAGSMNQKRNHFDLAVEGGGIVIQRRIKKRVRPALFGGSLSCNNR